MPGHEHIRVFISYKKLENHQPPEYARTIATVLKDTYRFQVFWDELSINIADQWANRIYNEIHNADVLILLLVPQTADSEWVQREVDVARGSGVSIIQLLIGEFTSEDVSQAQKKLALETEQHSNPFHLQESDFKDLVHHIQRLALETRDRQREQFRQREKHWYQMPIDSRAKVYSWRMPDDQLPRTRIHISIGDVMALPSGSLDAIVNSENDYLQMARFYQTRSLSGTLRCNGAWFTDGQSGRLKEDTVQRDLLAAYGDDLLPASLTQVLVTPAGHPKAELRVRKKVKVILHAITVQYSIGHSTTPVQPMNEHQFQRTIENCFKRVAEINADADFRASIAPDFASITTIAFPLFGVGGSVLSIPEAAAFLVNGLYRALMGIVNDGAVGTFTVQDIHLLAYSPSEAEPIRVALDARFQPL